MPQRMPAIRPDYQLLSRIRIAKISKNQKKLHLRVVVFTPKLFYMKRELLQLAMKSVKRPTFTISYNIA